MRTILIRNALLFDGNRVTPGAEIRVDGSTVQSAGPVQEGAQEDSVAGPARQIIDARGRLVTPGLVNAHTHIYSALACGIALKDEPPATFTQVLERLWWRLDRVLTLPEIELSAQLHGIDCLRAGVTTIFDHHASQTNVTGSLHAIADVLEGIGLRACLCFEVTDREGPEITKAGLAENVSILERAETTRGHHLRAMVGLHASMTLSNETLAAARTIADRHNAGFHIHVAEAVADQEDAERQHGLRVVERLAREGILGDQTFCVHGVHLDDVEMGILANSRSTLIHCPQSNMNNAVGAVHLRRLQEAGVRLALGTDGFTANLWRESLCAHLLQNHLAADPREGYTVVPTLLAANQRLASETFGLSLGEIKPGSRADLVVWDYVPATPLHSGNVWGHVLFGLVGARAAEVLVDGELRLSSGAPTATDEAQLRHECGAAAEKLWQRF